MLYEIWRYTSPVTADIVATTSTNSARVVPILLTAVPSKNEIKQTSAGILPAMLADDDRCDVSRKS